MPSIDDSTPAVARPALQRGINRLGFFALAFGSMIGVGWVTALGPWFVPAAEVPDPHALALRTFVNGKLTQQGHTSNMVHRVAPLIAWLSGFMTLAPGDVILTGTPEGVGNVNAGDEAVCEIHGIGRLVNTLADDAAFGL